MPMMDFGLWQYGLIAVLGVVAGVVNVLAGGGSNLILPVLMMFGVPPDVANGTNRVGIFLQSLTGIKGFHGAQRLPTADLQAILLPTLVGGLCGSVLAAYLPNVWLKPLLLGTMLAMAAIMLFRPATLLPPEGTLPLTVAQAPRSRFWLWLAGVYGGFVQAGVGFVLIVALGGLLRYDLVAANALKLVCTLAFTTVALLVFVAHDQVWWTLGLVLAAGNMLGAAIGVRTAIKLQAKTLKWILFVMTLVAVLGAWWF